jgi:hypothetical protein
MTYRGSWRHTRGFWVLLVVIACPAIALGFAERSPGFVAIGFALLAYLWALGRLSVSIDEGKIRYRGWLKTTEFRWGDVTAVMGRYQMAFYRRQQYGDWHYEVRAGDDRFVVNLLYFPREFRDAFLREVKARKLLRREDDRRSWLVRRRSRLK